MFPDTQKLSDITTYVPSYDDRLFQHKSIENISFIERTSEYNNEKNYQTLIMIHFVLRIVSGLDVSPKQT